MNLVSNSAESSNGKTMNINIMKCLVNEIIREIFDLPKIGTS